MESKEFLIQVADGSHVHLADTICHEYESSAKARGTGIAQRSPEYVRLKMEEGKAVVAFRKKDLTWAGFCYIETWSHGRYVANSGLIVAPEIRKSGLARLIKERIFDLSRTKYPEAKIFGLTTGLAVMKINSELGYEPVTYSELTQEEEFWKGCRSCVNYEILMAKNRSNCICTAMLYDPASKLNQDREKKRSKHSRKLKQFERYSRLLERWNRLRKRRMLRQQEQVTQAEKPDEAKPKSLFKNLFTTLFGL
jgi:hypothetical protein